MRFLPTDPEVTLYETVFGDDILERGKVSKSLSDLLNRTEDPLVVALNVRWGTGKSYFLKRWVGAHRGQNDGRILTLCFVTTSLIKRKWRSIRKGGSQTQNDAITDKRPAPTLSVSG